MHPTLPPQGSNSSSPIDQEHQTLPQGNPLGTTHAATRAPPSDMPDSPRSSQGLGRAPRKPSVFSPKEDPPSYLAAHAEKMAEFAVPISAAQQSSSVAESVASRRRTERSILPSEPDIPSESSSMTEFARSRPGTKRSAFSPEREMPSGLAAHADHFSDSSFAGAKRQRRSAAETGGDTGAKSPGLHRRANAFGRFDRQPRSFERPDS